MPEPPDPLPAQLREALLRGRLVEVLRRVGPKKFRDARARDDAAQPTDDAFGGLPGSVESGLAPGEVPRTSSNAWLYVVIGLAAFLLYYLLEHAG